MNSRLFQLKNVKGEPLIQGVFIVIVFWIFFRPMILHAYNLTVNATIPSGDDIYVHAYYSLRVLHDSHLPFYYRVLNETIIPTQYPNIIHYALAPLYSFTSDPLLLIKSYGILELITVIIGAILYVFLINHILAKKRLQTIILSSLIPLFSYWILQTLAAGSVMYLLDILVLLPLTTLLLFSRRFLIAGLTFGLSCLNWLGFLLIGLLISTWFLTEILSVLTIKGTRNTKLIFESFVQLLLGLFVGGNIFLIRFMMYSPRTFSNILPVSSTLSAKISAVHFRPVLTFDKFSSYLYIKNEYFLFVVLLLAFATILLTFLFRGGLKSDLNKIIVWLNIFWIALLLINVMLINFMTPNAFEIQIRYLRTLSFLTVIPIVSFISMITNICKLRNSFSRFNNLKSSKCKYLQKEAVHELLIMITVIMLLSSQFFNFFIKLDRGPDGLFRISEEELRGILLFRERFIKMDHNVIILGINQVGSFLVPLLSIPDQNVTVFLLTPPALLVRLDSEDPERKFSEIFIKSLLMNDSRILSSYNIKYLILCYPQETQFYWKEVLEFSRELWNMDFSTLGEMVYKTDKIKIWRLKVISSND